MAKDVTPASANGELRAVESFIDYAARRVQEDASTEVAWELTAAQMDRILTAETDEQMWTADDLDSVAGKDLEDVEQRILSVVYREGDEFEHGIPLGNGKFLWVLVTAIRLSDNFQFTWNTGSPLIIGKLRRMEAEGYYGTEKADCVIKGSKTPRGRIIKLKEIPKRAEQATAEVIA